MANGAESSLEVNVCVVYVFVCESIIFEGCHSHLDLSCGVAMWSKTFLVEV